MVEQEVLLIPSLVLKVIIQLLMVTYQLEVAVEQVIVLMLVLEVQVEVVAAQL